MKDGKGTIKFINSGKEPHSATLVRFEAGKTFKDLDKSIDAFFKEEKLQSEIQWPVVFLGGFSAIAPGTSIWMTIDLPPGTYGLDCDQRTDDEKEHGRDLGHRITFEVT